MSALAELDRRLLMRLYAAASVSTTGVRALFRRLDKPFVDPLQDEPVTGPELVSTARWVISQSRQGATAWGGMVGVAGALTVPPEILGTAVAILRLGQRLAIVYGVDPQTDRGKMVLWRALAAGLEIELPDRGPVGLSVRELVRAPNSRRTVGGALARSLVRRSAWMVAGRLFRHVPVLSTGIAAVSARNRMGEVGDRMHDLIRKIAEPPTVGPIEDAQEI